MGAQFRDERDVTPGRIDPVNHEVAGARHRHEIFDALNDERGVEFKLPQIQ